MSGSLARLAYPHPRYYPTFLRIKGVLSTIILFTLLHLAKKALFGDDQNGDEEFCRAYPAHSHDLRQHCDQVRKLPVS